MEIFLVSVQFGCISYKWQRKKGIKIETSYFIKFYLKYLKLNLYYYKAVI